MVSPTEDPPDGQYKGHYTNPDMFLFQSIETFKP